MQTGNKVERWTVRRVRRRHIEESKSVFVEKAKEFLKGGKVKISNFLLKTKFKGRIIGDLSSIAFYDNAGKYCGAKTVFKDRTKILAIESLERKYETMLEDGIGSMDTIIIIQNGLLKSVHTTDVQCVPLNAIEGQMPKDRCPNLLGRYVLKDLVSQVLP